MAGASLSSLILAVLADGPSHGYAIAREIERRSIEALHYGEGTLYPALKSLELDGFVLSLWLTPESGPARRVYSLTEAGQGELRRVRVAWREYSQTIERVLGTPETLMPCIALRLLCVAMKSQNAQPT